jgi:dipeptidase E
VSGRHIVAFGGFDGEPPLLDYLLELTGVARPKVAYLGTAVGDADLYIRIFYERFTHPRCDPFHVRLFGVPDRPNERLAEADAVYVSGGNTANMLAVWRVHGIDVTLRELWERGVVLTGASAGAICWFEAGVTDSFSAELDPLDDCLGFLAGSMCPHYDGEERRRPVYSRLVREGRLPPGVAADDFVGLHYAGIELAAVVTDRSGAAAYRVTPDGEERIEPRVLQ